MDNFDPNNDLPSIEKLLGGNNFLIIVVIIIVTLFCFKTIGKQKIKGEEIGVFLNKISGKTTTKQTGTHFYNGLWTKPFILDRKIQTLEMTADVGRGDRAERDDLKIKTIDGSDVYVDIIVQYKIDPSQADFIIKTSGLKDAYKKKWARDYVRSIVRNFLGELTTEEFYDSNKRNGKIRNAEEKARAKLIKFGLILDRIDMPKKPRFYKEYEEMIKKKKSADQTVLEEHSKAQAAKQKQQTLIVEETNKKNVAVEQFKGKMEQKIISAKAEGEKVRKAADAYYDKITIGAEAYLYKKQKDAEGILAKKKKQAQGIEAMKIALEGEGGRNMVKMEYAKKLKDITISGKPFTYEGHTERFQHLKGPASFKKGDK